MNRPIQFLIGLSWLGLWGGAQATWCSSAPPLADYLSEDRFARATWGVQVESLRTGSVLYSHDGHRLLQPASSAKLLVAALVLDQFESRSRRVTTLHAEAEPDTDGVLAGRLVLRGSGDFSWSEQFGAGRPEAILARLTRIVHDAGIRRIEGGLVGDTRLFRGPAWGIGWGWDDLQYGYGGEVSALMFRDARVELRLWPGERVGSACAVTLLPSAIGLDILNLTHTGERNEPGRILIDRRPGSRRLVVTGRWPVGGQAWSETVSESDPASACLEALRTALVAEGIQIDAPNRVLDWALSGEGMPDYRRMKELGSVASPPMGEMVRVMMQSSQNQYAQILLLFAGADREAQRATRKRGGPAWTADLGLEALREFLNRMGVDLREVRLDEASGLARSDRVSPAALVCVLRTMITHRQRESFLAGFPVKTLDTPGGSVTLRVKSGTMSDIYTLAGYLERPVGEPLVFSLMLNGFVPSQPGEGHAAVLDCVRRIAALGLDEGAGN